MGSKGRDARNTVKKEKPIPASIREGGWCWQRLGHETLHAITLPLADGRKTFTLFIAGNPNQVEEEGNETVSFANGFFVFVAETKRR